MKTVPWKDWLVFGLWALGVWILISPWIIPHTMMKGDFGGIIAYISNMYPVDTSGSTNAVMWNMYLIGIAIATTAGAALVVYRTWEAWSAIGLGGWLIISPWLVGFGSALALTWNAVLAGAAVVLLAAWVIGIAQEDDGAI